MPNVIISGCNGKMGQAVTKLCSEQDDLNVVAGFDINTVKLSSYPVFAKPSEFAGDADVVIDFSSSNSLETLLDYCRERKLPVVLCTTGYSEEQLKKIDEASKEFPVFRSGNMSLGINLLTGLVKKAAAVLGDSFDIEIVERHHNQKLDAPSGTALMLADAAAEGREGESEYVYDRHSVRKKREKKEIGISAVRGGTIVGQHEVIFAGFDEVIELKHSAYSRNVFASGAVSAAKYMANVTKPGLYDMNDVLKEVLDK